MIDVGRLGASIHPSIVPAMHATGGRAGGAMIRTRKKKAEPESINENVRMTGRRLILCLLADSQRLRIEFNCASPFFAHFLAFPFHFQSFYLPFTRSACQHFHGENRPLRQQNQHALCDFAFGQCPRSCSCVPGVSTILPPQRCPVVALKPQLWHRIPHSSPLSLPMQIDPLNLR